MAQMPRGNISEQQMKYYQLIQQGMPAQQAFNMAFPEGLDPNRIQKEAANDQQKAALGQILGTVGGAVTTANIAGLFGGGTTAASTLGTGATLSGYSAGGGLAASGAAGAGTAATGSSLGASLAGGGAAAGSVGGAGAAGLGTTAATTPGLGTSAAALATNPVTLAIAAALAGGINYNRNRQKFKSMSASDGFKKAARDPINWIIPGGLWGAMFGNKDRYLTEDIRLRKLQGEGYNIPESALTQLEHGRSMEELVKLEQDKIANKQFGNTKFAQSRNEADLTPLDIAGYASIYKQAGKDKAADNNYRMELARRALEANAVRERHGTIDVDWSKVNTKDIGQYGGPSVQDFAKDPNLDWRNWRKPKQTITKK